MANPEIDNYVIPKKRPLVAILMADGYKDSVEMGEKLITIREGWRDYHVGEKVILCNPNPGELDGASWCVSAKITGIRHCSLKEVSLNDLNDDKFVDLDHAVESLGAFYPDMNPESLVTVIRWELV